MQIRFANSLTISIFMYYSNYIYTIIFAGIPYFRSTRFYFYWSHLQIKGENRDLYILLLYLFQLSGIFGGFYFYIPRLEIHPNF